ncbi:MAG: rRNA maturation RNase YbeY [Patescibacteria group bacterium]
MIKVLVKKQGNYPVSTKKIRDFLKKLFKEKGIVSDAEVSVSLVGEAKMLDIGRKYLGDKKIHNVLSFTQEEVRPGFVYPPDGIIHLGEIVVCYPVAFEEAKKEGKLIEEKVLELIEHGALHLLGIHHD